MVKEAAVEDDASLGDREEMLCGTPMVVKGTPSLRLEIAGSAMQLSPLNTQQKVPLGNVLTSRPAA